MSRIADQTSALRRRCLRPVLWTALLTASIAPFTASGRDASGEDRYEVEVIVFENLDDAPGDPRAEVTTRVGPAADEGAGDDDPDTGEPSGAQRTPQSSEMDGAELRLEKAWSRLEKADGYRPVVHRAWTRTPADGDDDPGVRLRSDTPLQPLPAEVQGPVYAVDGTVALIERRYLHLRADLTLSEVEEDAPAGLGGDQQSLWQPLAPQRTMMRYRLSQSRRIETGTLTYFDHPRFGLLVEVRPVGTARGDAEQQTQP